MRPRSSACGWRKGNWRKCMILTKGSTTWRLLNSARAACGGTHYHRIKRERVYVLQGRLTVVVEDIQTRERAPRCLWQPATCCLSSLVSRTHCKRAEAGQALELAPGRFDPADIYPYPLI